ncbi:MAG TPA: DUF3810 domain-containing protein [Chitinophagaceae bacterium]|jgi:ribosomal protein S19|nr:DUF3810 domain-containing protein [Chitinophagaceae bacterium]
MLKAFFKDRILLFLIIFSIAIKLLTLNAAVVERYYTYGLYPYLAIVLRILFGWLPFSIGDLIYLFAFGWSIYLIVLFLKRVKKRKFSPLFIKSLLRKVIILSLLIYITFQVFWGLNYSRQGIAHQLGLTVTQYTLTDLDTLTTVLQQRLNDAAQLVDSNRRAATDNNHYLFDGGKKAYDRAFNKYPFLKYSVMSLKPSLYSSIGHYFGFTGYYNPFSGEAQINTKVPPFLKPFIITHEIGHQLGYGKENEANFVSFLACKNAADEQFTYSIYFELYLYALREIGRRDTLLVKSFKEKVHPQVKKDNAVLIAYLKSTENKIEPYITSFYDQYLKMNSQPKGMRTYNEVVAWLIAYQKKYGIESI